MEQLLIYNNGQHDQKQPPRRAETQGAEQRQHSAYHQSISSQIHHCTNIHVHVVLPQSFDILTRSTSCDQKEKVLLNALTQMSSVVYLYRLEHKLGRPGLLTE